MAEETTTTLDVEWLKTFIKEHVEEFRAELEKMGKPSPEGVPSMDDLGVNDSKAGRAVAQDGPLLIGIMGGGKGEQSTSDIVGGSALNQKLGQGGANIADLLAEQKFFFRDIQDALEATIEELTDTQSANLDSLSVDDFMDIFEDVDLGGGGIGGGGGGGGSGSGGSGSGGSGSGGGSDSGGSDSD